LKKWSDDEKHKKKKFNILNLKHKGATLWQIIHYI